MKKKAEKAEIKNKAENNPLGIFCGNPTWRFTNSSGLFLCFEGIAFLIMESSEERKTTCEDLKRAKKRVKKSFLNTIEIIKKY